MQTSHLQWDFLLDVKCMLKDWQKSCIFTHSFEDIKVMDKFSVVGILNFLAELVHLRDFVQVKSFSYFQFHLVLLACN
jgi:hypothetical protein